MTDYFVGLDISQKSTSICITDAEGKRLHEGASLTRPQDIYGWLSNRIDVEASDIRVGLEAGTLSAWLHRGLSERGLHLTMLETFQAHRFLATFRNKTDKNDAHGLAQLLRMGGEDFLRVVKVRSIGAQETRTMLSIRFHLVTQKVALENHIAGILKPYGVIVRRNHVNQDGFRNRVLIALKETELHGLKLTQYVLPALDLYRSLCNKIKPMTERVETLARDIPMVKRFMHIPGVGPITALSFYCAVDEPERFKKSTDVAAYFGLTPRQCQSGDINYTTGISKRGDPSVRRALVTAATVLLTNTTSWCSLKAWGVRLAKRIGMPKARVAVARKLAIIMHKMWIKNDRWRPKAITPKDRQELMGVTLAPRTPLPA